MGVCSPGEPSSLNWEGLPLCCFLWFLCFLLSSYNPFFHTPRIIFDFFKKRFFCSLFGSIGSQLWHMHLRCVMRILLLQHVDSLWLTASVVAACRLSCLTAHGILVPRPGLEATSPEFQCEFLAIKLPRNSPPKIIFQRHNLDQATPHLK